VLNACDANDKCSFCLGFRYKVHNELHCRIINYLLAVQHLAYFTDCLVRSVTTLFTDSLPSELSNKRLLYVSVQLTDSYAFHVIVLPFENGQRYVACAEVSALLWDEDILRTKVACLADSFRGFDVIMCTTFRLLCM